MASKYASNGCIPFQYLMKCFKIKEEKNQYILHRQFRSRTDEGYKRMSEYKGIIIPDGVLVPDEDVVTAEARLECGFTNALFELFPLSLKNKVGSRWMEYLREILRVESPESYLLVGFPDPIISREIGPTRERLIHELPVSLDDLKKWFGNICILSYQGIRVVSPLSEFQKEKAKELHISHMEVLRHERA